MQLCVSMEACTRRVSIAPPGTNVDTVGGFLGACFCASELQTDNVESHCEEICGNSAVRLGHHHSAPAAALQELEDGPYFVISSFLDVKSLGAVDAACRLLRELNQAHSGPWQSLGSQTFHGLELENDGIFELGCDDNEGSVMEPRRLARVDWRGRFARFRAELPTFRAPFAGSEILSVQQAGVFAECRCRLRTDFLRSDRALNSTAAAYLEVEVLKNPDIVNLAVGDFEAGGCSSVTFSPDNGAVIRARLVREEPGKVEEAYIQEIQPLATITAGQGFEGSMGLYLRGGHLAFFRRHYRSTGDANEAPELGAWETTGFVTDLSWAEGHRLTPCLVFRNEGSYQVRMVCVSYTPPVMPERTEAAYQDGNWSSLYLEDATQQDAPEI
eukprot:TRINITY_DN16164_c0_g1_i1.p1 TRINITY_DN16164_c0_g1~~TRINITY_DN16164_c0_g1_i1.p1  ORF type:complete len:386 (-),score=81.62 TRINITY_DN16164_c0_g1_i1:164-1321(-)